MVLTVNNEKKKENKEVKKNSQSEIVKEMTNQGTKREFPEHQRQEVKKIEFKQEGGEEKRRSRNRR